MDKKGIGVGDTVNNKARIWWKGMMGTVLATGKETYFAVFGGTCQFVPIKECVVISNKQ